MRSVSAAFADAVQRDHTVVAKAEVLRDGLVQRTLPIMSGQVTADVDNAIRRRCQATLTDPEGDLTPADADDLLAPFGTELRLWRGVRHRKVEPYSEYPDVVQGHSPFGYWRLEEESGTTAVDVSGGGRDGQFMGSYTLGERGALTDGSNSVHVSGGGRMEIAGLHDSLFAGAGAVWTVETWANPDAEFPTNWLRLWSSETSDAAGRQGITLVQYKDTGQIAAEYWVNGLVDAAGTGATLPPGEWSHVVVTFDGSTLRVFINGAEAGVEAVQAGDQLALGTALCFGAYPGGGSAFEGHLDELAVYDRVLTADEIKAHHEESAKRLARETFTDELVSLGVFGLSSSDAQDSADGVTIKVDGYDRARRVQRARFTEVYTVAAGTNYADAIKTLIQDRVPSLTDKDFSFIPTTRTTPALSFEVGDDPWEKAQDMADSMGCDLYFDADGVCTLRRVEDPVDVPAVTEFREGETATLLSVGKKMTDQYTYNYVVVVGEPMDEDVEPVRAIAQDTDADSPTNVNGDYGVVVRFLTSPYIVSTAQAQDAADSLLARYKGGTEVVTFAAIPNPALEAGDVVEIVRGRAKVDAKYVVDAFRMPLSQGAEMTVTTRRRRI